MISAVNNLNNNNSNRNNNNNDNNINNNNVNIANLATDQDNLNNVMVLGIGKKKKKRKSLDKEGNYEEPLIRITENSNVAGTGEQGMFQTVLNKFMRYLQSKKKRITRWEKANKIYQRFSETSFFRGFLRNDARRKKRQVDCRYFGLPESSEEALSVEDQLLYGTASMAMVTLDFWHKVNIKYHRFDTFVSMQLLFLVNWSGGASSRFGCSCSTEKFGEDQVTVFRRCKRVTEENREVS